MTGKSTIGCESCVFFVTSHYFYISNKYLVQHLGNAVLSVLFTTSITVSPIFGIFVAFLRYKTSMATSSMNEVRLQKKITSATNRGIHWSPRMYHNTSFYLAKWSVMYGNPLQLFNSTEITFYLVLTEESRVPYYVHCIWQPSTAI